MLAMLLAFTMVLTFIPMLAFAEGEEADAEPQVTEETAEEVEAEAAVEAEVGAQEPALLLYFFHFPDHLHGGVVLGQVVGGL